MKRTVIIILTFFCLNPLFSQNTESDIYELGFEELTRLKISSASKAEEKMDEVPSTIRVITAEDISKRAYITLEEALSDLPGFQFRNTQGFNSYIFQRGIPNQNNLSLLLIDGIQVNELNSGGFYGGGQYNLSNVDRIEIVYGPSSVAYGTNALSGVINIITKKASKNNNRLGGMAGSFNTLVSEGSYSYINEKTDFSIIVSGMAKQTEKMNLKGSHGDNNWSDLMQNFENDYAFDLKTKAKNLTFGTNILNKNASTTTNFKSMGTAYNDFGSNWNILFVNNYLKYDKQLNDKLELSSTLYHRNTTVLRNSIYYVLDTAQVGYYRPNCQAGLESILHYKPTKNIFTTAGVVLEYDHLANNPSITYSNSIYQKPPTPSKPEMHNNFLISAFLEPKMELAAKFFLSAGIRYDYSTVYSHVFTPRIGALYKFNNGSLRASYSEAFRAPKPWDYTDGIGNTGLLPEKLNSFESSLLIFPTQKLQIELTGYYNLLENGMMKETLQNSYRWINSGIIKTSGFEVSARYKEKYFDAAINYTFNNSKNEEGNYVPEIAKHTGNAGFTVYPIEKIYFNARVNFVGKRENSIQIASTQFKYIEPFWLFNTALGWNPSEKIDVRLIVKNITDTAYYHTSNRTPERYRQPQRTILLSISYLIGG
jgi:outer membrane receptor for ferrienterochelin and colicins